MENRNRIRVRQGDLHVSLNKNGFYYQQLLKLAGGSPVKAQRIYRNSVLSYRLDDKTSSAVRRWKPRYSTGRGWHGETTDQEVLARSR